MERDLEHLWNDPRPAALARDLAAALVRAFAAVDELLREQRESSPRLAPDQVAAQLQASLGARLDAYSRVFGPDRLNDVILLLEEAVDNLGCGEHLEAASARAFRV